MLGPLMRLSSCRRTRMWALHQQRHPAGLSPFAWPLAHSSHQGKEQFLGPQVKPPDLEWLAMVAVAFGMSLCWLLSPSTQVSLLQETASEGTNASLPKYSDVQDLYIQFLGALSKFLRSFFEGGGEPNSFL